MAQPLQVVNVNLHDVRSRLLRVVERAHQHVVGAGVANVCVADTTANVRLDHSLHLRVCDQQDRPVNVFQERVLRELRRTYKVGRVHLVLIQGFVSERLKRQLASKCRSAGRAPCTP